MDADDKLTENTLENVYAFFEEHYDEIDLVAIPMYFFERKTGDHRLNYKFSETRVVDLVEEPNYPQLSSSSAFFKNDVLKKYTFPTNVSFSEDSILINKLLLEKKKYGLSVMNEWKCSEKLIIDKNFKIEDVEKPSKAISI